MQNFELIVILFSITISLVALCDRFKIPNPVLLVVAGVSVGFIPNLPVLSLNPEVVFLLFLPPILYDAAANTSWHDFKSEIKPITTLAVALVLFTTLAVGTAAYFMIPEFTWPMAFVLGAIVSPPDAVAATNITRGLGLNKRVVTILEGESLVNDATALIAYRFALAAIGTGTFIFGQAILNFLWVGVGGIVTGIVVGYLVAMVHAKIISNSMVSTALSLLTPYLSYLLAELFHTSGVLAVVSSGLIISWRGPEVFTHQTRIRNKTVWSTLIFLLNNFVFVLIGLQLKEVVNDLGNYSIIDLLTYSAAIGTVTILIRIISVFGFSLSGIANSKTEGATLDKARNWKNNSIIAWTGTRGVVTLATAMALPVVLAPGTAFPQRALILFLALVVILITLVLQGITLPWLIRALKVPPPDTDRWEEIELRLFLAGRVSDFIKHKLHAQFPEDELQSYRTYYEDIIDHLLKEWKNDRVHTGIRVEEPDSLPLPAPSIEMELHKFQRELLITVHKAGNYDHALIRRVEAELDLEELKLSRSKN